MLVVMHDGNVEFGFQPVFDFEALGSLDVFEIDAAECGGDGLHGLNEFLGVFLVDFDVEYVDAGKNLEQQAFPFHDRLSGQGPYVAKSQHGRTIGDDRDKVAF